MAKWIMDIKTINSCLLMNYYVLFEYQGKRYGIGTIGYYGILTNVYLIDLFSGYRQMFLLKRNLWKHAAIENTTLEKIWDKAVIISIIQTSNLNNEVEYLHEICEVCQDGK